MKPGNVATLTWFGAFLCLVLAHSFMGLGSILVWMALTLYTVGFAAILLFRVIKTRHLATLYPVALMVFVLILWFLTPLNLVSPYLRLFVEERAYKHAIEAAATGNTAPCDELGCVVEDMNEKQVAFVWAGIIDNWHGICHDPTATVLKANILKGDWSNRDDPEYGKAAGMFEGTMVGAVHLWADWYLCSFT